MKKCKFIDCSYFKGIIIYKFNWNSALVRRSAEPKAGSSKFNSILFVKKYHFSYWEGLKYPFRRSLVQASNYFKNVMKKSKFFSNHHGIRNIRGGSSKMKKSVHLLLDIKLLSDDLNWIHPFTIIGLPESSFHSGHDTVQIIIE